jgi:hypothetical protein
VAVLTEELRVATPPEGGRRAATAEPAVVAAALSLAAAAIHFAFAPEHFGEYTSHGAFFLGLGVLQAAWAVAVLVRPSRALRLLGLLNAVVIGVWIVSRTVGIPRSAGAEGIGLPDVLATAFEAGIVLYALRPNLGRLRPAAALAASTVIAAATVVSLTPRYAGAHADHAAGAVHAAGAAHAHGTTPAAALTPCEQAGPIDDGSAHDHRGPSPQQPIDQPTRLALAGQQAQARAVAAKFSTVADAEAAGYRMSTPFVPCIGAHYTNLALVAAFDPSAPSELLFDGTEPTSKLVGLSYLVYHPGGAPEGFAGPNDAWHQHNQNGGLCFNRAGVVIAGENSTPQQCGQLGGFKRELTDVWMLHDWVVPGWECSWGTFAAECPELGGKVGQSAWAR